MDNLKYNSDKLLGIKDGDWYKVLKHFNVTEEYEKECIDRLRHWYIHQPHLPPIELDFEKKEEDDLDHSENLFRLVERILIGGNLMDSRPVLATRGLPGPSMAGREFVYWLPQDGFFARQLANKGYNVENTKELIDNYFSGRLVLPEFLQNRDPLSEQVIKVFRELILCPLPKLTPEGHRVVIIKKLSNDWNLLRGAKVCTMFSNYRLKNDTSVGDHLVFCAEAATVSDIFQFTPLIIYKLAFLFTACVGMKIKGIHLVKVPSYGASLVNVLKKALKTKLAKRLYLHESFEDITKMFPKSMFPSDFGGDEPSTQELSDTWLKTFQSEPWRNWFLEQDKLVTDESKRLTKSMKFNDMFGVEGSFRNISFD